jgi:hypothetical protein
MELLMAKTKEISVGERWAYAVGDNPPAVAVDVLEIRASRSGRVMVRFVEGADRADEWVHPSRLKALWVNREAYFESMAKWREISSKPDSIEDGAVEATFRAFIAPAAGINHGKIRGGTMTIYDFDLVDVFIGGHLEEILEGAASLEDGSVTHYSWATAVAVAHALCQAKPQRVMSYVHAEEAEGQKLANVGSPRARALGMTRAEAIAWEASFYEEYTRPMCDLLRSWCGEAPAAIQDMLRSLRQEALRLDGAVIDACLVLTRVGQEADSWRIYKQAHPEAEKAAWTGVTAKHRFEHR